MGDDIRSDSKEYRKLYYEKNKQRIAEHKARYYQKNREKNIEKAKEYRKNNAYKIKEYLLINKEKKKEYYKKNKIRISQQEKIRREKNKEKIAARKAELYRQNKEKYIKQATKRRKKGLKFINRVKLKFGCKNCGYKKHPSALDFHHIRDKKYQISKITHSSLRCIKKEMRKCHILCANCHRIEHYSNKPPQTSRARYVENIKNGSLCCRCKEDDNLCLNFCYPIKDQYPTVAAMSYNAKYTLEDIQSAIERCIVLCKNCQREERFPQTT